MLDTTNQRTIWNAPKRQTGCKGLPLKRSFRWVLVQWKGFTYNKCGNSPSV